MKVTILLCDYAQVAEGELNLIGGGWNIKAPQAGMGLGILVEVPWSESHDRHGFAIELVSDDGSPVVAQGPVGLEPVRIEGAFDLGRPPGHPRGAPLNLPLALNLPPLALPPKQRFEWRFSLDGQSAEDWRVGFTTMEMPPFLSPEATQG